jgi:Helix-turn-helix domain of resolvase
VNGPVSSTPSSVATAPTSAASQLDAQPVRQGACRAGAIDVGIAQIAKETGLTRQTFYRIKGDPAGAEGTLVAWGL